MSDKTLMFHLINRVKIAYNINELRFHPIVKPTFTILL